MSVQCQVGALNREALTILEGFIHEQPIDAVSALRAWMGALSGRIAEGLPIGVLEYLVLLTVARRDPLLASLELDGERRRAARLLVTMRGRLVGEYVPLDQVARLRLPRRLLARETRDVQALHAAVFRRLDERISSAILNLYAGYIPRPHDGMVALAVLSACSHPATLPMAAGLMHGYLFGTIVEHLIHKHVGHASPRRLARLEALLTWLGRPGRIVFSGVAAIAFRHGIVHHASYGASYVDPSGSTGGPAKRKARIDALVRRLPQREISDIIATGYGTSLAHPGMDALAIGAVSALSAWLASAVFARMGVPVSPSFVGAATATSLLFLALSHWVHPYLHMSREAALRTASPWMRWFLRSRYISHIARAHYLHHCDASINQNLAIGADFVLGYRMSSVESVLRLRAMGAFY